MKADPFSYAEFTKAIAKAKFTTPRLHVRRRYSVQCKSKTSATSSRRVCNCRDPRNGQRHVIRGVLAVARSGMEARQQPAQNRRFGELGISMGAAMPGTRRHRNGSSQP